MVIGKPYVIPLTAMCLFVNYLVLGRSDNNQRVPLKSTVLRVTFQSSSITRSLEGSSIDFEGFRDPTSVRNGLCVERQSIARPPLETGLLPLIVSTRRAIAGCLPLLKRSTFSMHEKRFKSGGRKSVCCGRTYKALRDSQRRSKLCLREFESDACTTVPIEQAVNTAAQATRYKKGRSRRKTISRPGRA